MAKRFWSHWENRIGWRSLASAALAAGALALAAGYPLSWWRLTLGIAALLFLRARGFCGAPHGPGTFWPLASAAARASLASQVPSSAPFLACPPWLPPLLFGVFLAAAPYIPVAGAPGSRTVSRGTVALTIFAAAFLFFTLAVRFIPLSRELFFLLGVWFACAIGFPAADAFLHAPSAFPFGGRAAGAMAGIVGIEIAFLLFPLSLSPLASAILLLSVLIFLVHSALLAAEGTFSPRRFFWELAGTAVLGVLCIALG